MRLPVKITLVYYGQIVLLVLEVSLFKLIPQTVTSLFNPYSIFAICVMKLLRYTLDLSVFYCLFVTIFFSIMWFTYRLDEPCGGRQSNAGSMLAHRLRRWSNAKPTSDRRPAFAT